MKKIILLASIGLLLGACSLTQKSEQVAPAPAPKIDEAMAPIENNDVMEKTDDTDTAPMADLAGETKSYTAAEVAEHSNGQSCWLILDNKVYDVTTFIGKHPGGEAILKGCGKDATKMFAKHPESAKAMKEQFYIGDLKM